MTSTSDLASMDSSVPVGTVVFVSSLDTLVVKCNREWNVLQASEKSLLKKQFPISKFFCLFLIAAVNSEGKVDPAK